jgi:hypothetical protein
MNFPGWVFEPHDPLRVYDRDIELPVAAKVDGSNGITYPKFDR